MKLDDLTGQRFGRLKVKEYVGGGKWKCICDCGNTKLVNGYKLKSGNTVSCGCYKSEFVKSVWKNTAYSETRKKMSEAKRGKPPRHDVLEKAWADKKKSVRGGWNPNNSCAKEWILISPDGVQYGARNLHNFIRENAELFGISTDEQEIRKIAKLFAVLKWHIKHDGKQKTCCGGWSIIVPDDDRRNIEKLTTE